MRYGSLCSGIGGLDRAIERVLSVTPAWFCEADKHAASVLRRWWPDVPVLPDLKTQDWTQVEPVELVSAGYPCQPFSAAGRRLGEEDERHLWPFVISAIRVLRPQHVILENVAGHLGLGFDTVLGDLAEAGFDAEWAVVPASAAGACHRRERLFVVADADGPRLRDARSTGPPRAGSGRPSAKSSRHREVPADAKGDAGRQFDGDGLRTWGDYRSSIERWSVVLGRPVPVPLDEKGRLTVPFVEWMQGFDAGWVDGLERSPALRCLGNAVVQQQGELALRMLLEVA